MTIDTSRIKITEGAINYLNKKGKLSLTIGYPDYRTNGDFAVVPVPEIFAKKPKVVDEYNNVNINGIDIYISKLVKIPKEDVVIDVSSFLGIKFLIVSGFTIKNQ